MNRRPEPANVQHAAAAGPAPVNQEDCNKIKSLLFEQKGRPQNFHDIKVVNVFDDRYRINVWVRSSEDGLDRTKIGASYFARFDGESLEIRA